MPLKGFGIMFLREPSRRLIDILMQITGRPEYELMAEAFDDLGEKYTEKIV